MADGALRLVLLKNSLSHFPHMPNILGGPADHLDEGRNWEDHVWPEKGWGSGPQTRTGTYRRPAGSAGRLKCAPPPPADPPTGAQKKGSLGDIICGP